MEVEKYYKKQAQELIDILSDKGFLANDLSREGSRWLEDFVGFLFQSQCEMAVKAALLTKKIKNE